jgi:hypothetical protein
MIIELLTKVFLRSAHEWKKTEKLVHWRQGNFWTVGNSFDGSFATGSSGSGKSSGAIAFQTDTDWPSQL